MAIYVVMEPGDVAQDEAQERATFVRDGFSFIAFVMPVLWLLWHRLWLAAAAALILTLGSAVLLEHWGGRPILAVVVPLLLAIYFGNEAPALQLASLRIRGWREWGALEAANRTEAELRYAELASQETVTAVSTPQRAMAGRGVTFPWIAT